MNSATRSFPVVVLTSALLAGAAGAALRHGLIEFKAVHNICAAASGSWLCDVRSQIIVTLMNTHALGLLALALGFFALFGNRRTLVIGAIVTGALGLFLYNAGLGACGLLMGALRAVRD